MFPISSTTWLLVKAWQPPTVCGMLCLHCCHQLLPNHLFLYRFTWWRHPTETFFALLAICAGNSPVTGEFPTNKGQWRGALMFSLICVWINGCVNNGEAGDLRCHRAHYDVIVMEKPSAYLYVGQIATKTCWNHKKRVLVWLLIYNDLLNDIPLIAQHDSTI